MMEVVKFDRILSVNSEIQGHKAQNILDGEVSPSKNWMCEKGTEKAILILQLERAAVITSIHIGNAHSAFVEVLVGKAAGGSDEFESLIPMSSFMNPHESKTGTNPNRTRFFYKADFNEATATKCWDRIKVVCTQPFNKHIPYGLCFLKVHGDREARKTEPPQQGGDEGMEIEVGSFFKKRRSGGDKPLTVSEQMKEAEKESSLSKHTPISIAKITARMSEKQSLEKNKKKAKEVLSYENEERGEKRKREEEKTPKKRRERQKPEIKKPRKPFERLMEDVVLVISGFQNPLRGNIRSKALEMGAKYSGDWEPRCTHLVCAYENTPKFNQVKGKGKIVRKEWVEKCFEDRKRYPWRRFALSKSDSKSPESEEEIEAGEDSEPEAEESPQPGTSKEGEGNGEKTKTSDDDYDVPTDEEGGEWNVDTSDYPMPYLPDVFSSKRFYVDPELREKTKVERYIVAYNGILMETFNEEVDFLVTEKGGAPIKLFRRKAPNLVAIKPSWIWEVNSQQKCIPTTPHLVNDSSTDRVES